MWVMQLIALELNWLKAEGLGTGWSFVLIKINFELLKQLRKAARLWGIAQDMSHVGPFSCSN